MPNIVPLMNLFLTIVPFLLTIVVISQVAMVALNFSAPGGQISGSGGIGTGHGPAQEIKLIIMASEGNQLYPGFEIRGWGKAPVSIRNNNQGYNFSKLNDTLAQMKKELNLDNISIIVYPDVLYGNMVQVIDLCKANGITNVTYKAAAVSYGLGG